MRQNKCLSLFLILFLTATACNTQPIPDTLPPTPTTDPAPTVIEDNTLSANPTTDPAPTATEDNIPTPIPTPTNTQLGRINITTPPNNFTIFQQGAARYGLEFYVPQGAAISYLGPTIIYIEDGGMPITYLDVGTLDILPDTDPTAALTAMTLSSEAFPYIELEAPQAIQLNNQSAATALYDTENNFTDLSRMLIATNNGRFARLESRFYTAGHVSFQQDNSPAYDEYEAEVTTTYNQFLSTLRIIEPTGPTPLTLNQPTINHIFTINEANYYRFDSQETATINLAFSSPRGFQSPSLTVWEWTFNDTLWPDTTELATLTPIAQETAAFVPGASQYTLDLTFPASAEKSYLLAVTDAISALTGTEYELLLTPLQE